MKQSLNGIPFVFEFINFVHKLKLNICSFYSNPKTRIYIFMFSMMRRTAKPDKSYITNCLIVDSEKQSSSNFFKS